MYTRLEEMQTRYSELMNSKTQLSSKLISSEEEKLQVRPMFYLRVAKISSPRGVNAGYSKL